MNQYIIDCKTPGNWTHNAAEITIDSSGMYLAALFSGSSTAYMNSDVNRSTWYAIKRLLPSSEETAGYSHRFMASFDGGATWRRRTGDIWVEAPLSGIATYGLTVWELERAADWFDESDTLRIAVNLARNLTTHPAAVGLLSGITVEYLLNTDPLDTADAPPREVPADTGGLSIIDSEVFAYPQDVAVSLFGESNTMESGHVVGRATATQRTRETLTLKSAPMSHVDALALLETYRGYVGQALKHRTPDEVVNDSAYRYFALVGDPTLSQQGPDVWAVSLPMVELIKAD